MLVRLAVAFVIGLLLAWRLEISTTALILFLAAAGIFATWLRVKHHAALPAFLLIALLLGATRYELVEHRPSHTLTEFHSIQGVMIEGAIVGDPKSSGTNTRLRLQADRVFTNGVWQDTSGDVLVTVRAPAEVVAQRDRPYFRYGDRLRLQGKLEPPPNLDEFDYPAYLARQGVYNVMSFPTASLQAENEGSGFYRWLYGVRHDLATSLTRSIAEPQASLGQSILLGIRDGLPEELEQDFRETGTSHLLAISGLHVGVLLAVSLGLSSAIFGRRRHLYLVMPLVLIWLYALMSGASPSAVRAAIMGTVYLAALLSGRPRNVLPALALAAVLMIVANPNIVWRISFQLSFAAMAGIAVLSDPIRLRFQGEEESASKGLPIKVAVIGMTSMTLAATITTMPLVAFYFQQVSLVGLPASLLTLPAMPFVLISNALAAFGGMISPLLGLPLGGLAWLFSSYVTGVVKLLASLPATSIQTGSLGMPVVVGWYAVLISAYVARNTGIAMTLVQHLSTLAIPGRLPHMHVRMIRPRSITWLTILVFALAAVVWVAAVSGPAPRLHVYFVDVGQGDAIFIVTPSGNQVLIDGGPDTQKIAIFLGQTMPPADRSIDLVVLTHPHADHATGLSETLRRYDIKTIMHRTADYESPTYQEWLRAVEQEKAHTVEARAGQVIAFEDGVTLQVLNPPERLPVGTRSDIDNASVVLRMTYGERSFLLAGDIFEESERRLLASGLPLDSDVLKVGHHGSRHATTQQFLDEVSPGLAVISAGADNRYGHPHLETIERLEGGTSPVLVYNTSLNGTVELVTDGETLEITSGR